MTGVLLFVLACHPLLIEGTSAKFGNALTVTLGSQVTPVSLYLRVACTIAIALCDKLEGSPIIKSRPILRSLSL